MEVGEDWKPRFNVGKHESKKIMQHVLRKMGSVLRITTQMQRYLTALERHFLQTINFITVKFNQMLDTDRKTSRRGCSTLG